MVLKFLSNIVTLSFLKKEGHSSILPTKRKDYKLLNIIKELGICYVAISSSLFACPIFLNIKNDLKKLSGQRKNIHIFSLDREQKWAIEPLQIDPLIIPEKEGKTLIDKSFMNEDLAEFDRITFRKEVFGESKKADTKWPCISKQAYEVIDYNEREKRAYILSCLSKPEGKIKQNLQAPSYLEDKSIIYSRYYSYQFNNANQMLFEQIALGSGKDRLLVAYDSDMAILADVKNFFSVVFNSQDIQSKIKTIYGSDYGINASISFFLNMLFFKISLALSTDVSFYADSTYIPMVLYLPVDANSYLNSKSGVVYHWLSGSGFKDSTRIIGMPTFTSADVFEQMSKNPNLIKEIAKDYCQKKGFCKFSYRIESPQSFEMEFRIGQDLVEKGFFPFYIKDFKNFSEKINWKFDKSTENREGFFFSTIALSQGNHAWDFWLHLGNKNETSNVCPYPIILKERAIADSLLNEKK